MSLEGGLHWSTNADNVPPSWDGRTNLLSTNDRGSQLITNLIKDRGEYKRGGRRVMQKTERQRLRERRGSGDKREDKKREKVKREES